MLRWRYRSLVKEGTQCHLLTLEEIWKHHLISESWQKASASAEIDFSAVSFNLNTVQYCRKNTLMQSFENRQRAGKKIPAGVREKTVLEQQTSLENIHLCHKYVEFKPPGRKKKQ